MIKQQLCYKAEPIKKYKGVFGTTYHPNKKKALKWAKSVEKTWGEKGIVKLKSKKC